MFKYAFIQLKNNMIVSILVMILLSMIFICEAFSVNVVQDKYKYLKPFSEFLKSDGALVESLFLSDDSTGNFLLNKNQLVDNYNEVEDAFGMYKLSEMSYDNMPICAVSYDKEIIDCYTPELEVGSWLDNADFENDSKYFDVVVSDNLNLKCGDVIQLSEPNYGYKIDVRVIGIISNDELVFGYDSLSDKLNGTTKDLFIKVGNIQYSGIFSNDDTDVCYPTFLFCNDQLSKHRYFDPSAGGDGTGIQRAMYGPTFIRFNGKYTNDKMIEVVNQFTNIGKINIIDNHLLKKQTKNYIFGQLYILLPIAISIFALVIIALVTIEVLDFKRSLDKYCIFFIVGMRMNQIITLRLFRAFLLHLCSLVFLFFEVSVLNDIILKKSWNIHFDGLCIFFVALTILFDLIVLLYTIKMMIGKSSVKTVICNNAN